MDSSAFLTYIHTLRLKPRQLPGMPKLSDVEVPLDQLYFDLACDAFPRGVPILLQLTEPFHIMYGTDYPAIPEMVLKGHLRNAKDCPQLQGHVDDVLWNNAAELFGMK